jgi:hypothetical protein
MSRFRQIASWVAQLRPKNLVPMTHVEHGWALDDSLTLFGDEVGGTVQVPMLDELERYYALPQGQEKGNCDSDRFRIGTLRYSLRRVSPLDSVNCRSHNPKVGGSNPPPATN